MADGLADHRLLPPLGAMELLSILKLKGVKGNQNWRLNWFELAGVSWSEFAAGTL